MNSGSKQQIDFKKSQKQVPVEPPLIIRGRNIKFDSPFEKEGLRKTSSEIVSEAKSLLSTSNGFGGGARLVNTRRPITPNDSRRQLYGMKAPAGRPPSSFSLRYLQNENSRTLPILDPINSSSLSENIFNGASNSAPTSAVKDTTKKNSLCKLPVLLSPLEQQELSKSLNNGKGDHHPLAKQKSKSIDLSNKIAYKQTSLDSTVKMNTKFGLPIDSILQSNEIKSVEIVENSEYTANTLVKSPTPGLLARNNDLLSQSSTDILLELLKAHAGIKECNEETIRHINSILVELYTRVKNETNRYFCDMLLGTLYGLVECSSGKILLAVARIILNLGVTGSNLTGACKLVFKVARNENNDHLFKGSDIPELLIDGLGRASPIDDPEACIYGYGAVRFLINSSISKRIVQNSIAQRLANHGCVQLMILHLQILNESGALKQLCGQPLHVIYQLAAVLRALAGTQSCNMQQMQNACQHLVKASEIAIGEPEIQENIIRTLSALSDHDECCEALCQYSGRIGILLGPCNKDENNQNQIVEKSLALLSRVGYILGNIMATFDEGRIHFYQNDVAMEYLIDTLALYSRKKFNKNNHSAGGNDTVIDVLIKLVRVIANISVNPEIGLQLSVREQLGSILLHLLTTTNKSLYINSNSDIMELNQAVLGALHNLCFYQDQIEDNSRLSQNECINVLVPKLCAELCNTINLTTENIRIEGARVLGNMTRNKLARHIFCKNDGLSSILHCLKSNNYDLQATSSGVLVNLLSDQEYRLAFRNLHGPSVLRQILHKCGHQEDWIFAAIICQAMWNYLIDSENITDDLTELESFNISELLAEYLDEERLFGGKQPDILWEHFAIVAADLLERIQCLSQKNSPNYLTDNDDEEDDVIIKKNSIKKL